MKKSLIKAFVIAVLSVFTATAAMAQETKKENKFGLANRVGIGVGYGTEGLGFDVAIPLTQYVQVRAGLNIFPNINFSETADIDVNGSYNGYDYNGSTEMDLNAKFGRTYADLKFDCYPFGNGSSFFVTAGLSFGGSDLLKITGHSDDAVELMRQGLEPYVEVADRQIGFDENGDITAGVKVKKVRPYLGLGFGRLIPKKRVGFRFEIGAQFQGKPKIYAGDIDNVLDEVGDSDEKDYISKVMDWLKVYPVIKFSLRGRIL